MWRQRVRSKIIPYSFSAYPLSSDLRRIGCAAAVAFWVDIAGAPAETAPLPCAAGVFGDAGAMGAPPELLCRNKIPRTTSPATRKALNANNLLSVMVGKVLY